MPLFKIFSNFLIEYLNIVFFCAVSLIKNNDDNSPNSETTNIVLILKIEISNNEARVPIAEPHML